MNSIYSFRKRMGTVLLALILLNLPTQLFGAEDTGPESVFKMSLEEIMDLEVKVEVASMFLEDELVVGSTVSGITPDKWERLGARRMHEALNNEMSVMAYSTFGGSPAIAIRGYVSSLSVRGIGTILDGVPLNGFVASTAFYQLPNWELGTLDRIEIIKGPGSAIYGSDAFHGVLSMKTFESDKDYCSIGASGGYPAYGGSNLKLSRGFADDLMRIDMSVGGSCQGDQDIEYEYDDAGTKAVDSRKNDYENKTGVLKLKVNPMKKLKIKIGGYANKWDSEDFQGAALYPADDLSSTTSSFHMGNGSVVYTLENNISIEGSGYYWEYDMTNELNASAADTAIEQDISEEIRNGASLIIKQPDNALDLQWVLAYSHTKMEIGDDVEQRVVTLSTGAINATSPIPAAGFTRYINSVFGQAKWGAIKDKMYLLIGGRYDDYSDFGRQYTPRGGVIFLPNENSVLKALYGRAYRAPAGTETGGNGVSIAANPDIKAETIDVYELIYMYKEDNWKATLSGFFSQWDNGIGAVVTVAPDSEQYVNKSENEAYGFEANLFYSMDTIAFDFGFSYVKSEEHDAVDPNNAARTTDLEYVAFPEYSVQVGAYYTLEQYKLNFYLNNRLYLNMEESGYDRNTDPDDLPTYWRTDLNISKDITKKLKIHLDIRNLFDRENYVAGIWGNENGVEEPGISVLVRANYRF